MLAAAIASALLAVAGAGTAPPADAARSAARVCDPAPCMPHPSITGVPERCAVRVITARVRTGTTAGARTARPRRLVLRLDGEAIARSRGTRLAARIRCSRLSEGRHLLVATVRVGPKRKASDRQEFEVRREGGSAEPASAG